MRDIINISLGIFVLALLLIAGTLEHADKQNSREMYCEMVALGHWPDYNKSFQTECKNALEAENE